MFDIYLFNEYMLRIEHSVQIVPHKDFVPWEYLANNQYTTSLNWKKRAEIEAENEKVKKQVTDDTFSELRVSYRNLAVIDLKKVTATKYTHFIFGPYSHNCFPGSASAWTLLPFTVAFLAGFKNNMFISWGQNSLLNTDPFEWNIS